MKKNYLFKTFIALFITMNVMAQNVPNYVPTNGLVGWWPFNGNAKDESGNGNDGIVNGASLSEDRYGNPNSAFSFDGVSNTITVQNSNSLQFDLKSFSYSFWIKLNNYPTNGKANNFIYKIDYPEVNGVRFWLSNQEGGSGIHMYVANGGYYSTVSVGGDYKTDLTLSKWHNVVFSSDSQYLYYYLNGELKSKIPMNGITYGLNNSNLFFGGPDQPNPSTDGYFNGTLDDIAIYDRSLTEPEISSIFTEGNKSVTNNIPSYVPKNGLIGWWPFNGNANDESGNNRHGTVNGATLSDDRNGNANCAYSFDGINNYISIDTNYLEDFKNGQTISLWFNRHGFIQTEGNAGDQNYIYYKGGNSLGQNIWVGDENNYVTYIYLNDSYYEGNGCSTIIDAFSFDSWNNYIITNDLDFIKVYLNGVLLNSKKIENINTTLNHSSDGKIKFGLGGGIYYGEKGFNGLLDDIAIYDRPLNIDEIKSLYSESKQCDSINNKPNIACYETATFNTSSCQWDVTGTQPAQPTIACYETVTFNTTTCSWDVTGTQPGQPTTACYETATFNTSTCQWDVTGTEPAQPTIACYETATFNTTTCSWDVTGTEPAQPTIACYETATFNTTTCSWDVTGTEPVQPTTACYETATFNTTTCSWDVTGTEPAQPTIACYETATFNTTTCSWDVTGTEPAQPTTACYETATFNTSTCQWDVTGTQPAQPTNLACYETATFNTSTCQWDVTGTQPAQPTTACYETATFNTTTCSWDVTGTQPGQPTTACYETATFNTSTCQWDVTGTQPAQPTTACYETATFNTSTCQWDVTGTQPAQPTTACYETATFNTSTCSWDVTGTQPAQPTNLACYETATFNTTTCSWDVTGSQPAQPTNLACYETAIFNTTSCSWDVTGTLPAQPTNLACYETATFNTSTCQWDVAGTQPTQPTTACYETATFNTTTCAWDVKGTQPQEAEIKVEQETTELNCKNTYLDLTATGGVSYEWIQTGETSAEVRVNKPGVYSVIATSGNGCRDTAFINITQSKCDTVLNLNKINKYTSMNVYPNPTSDVIIIDASDVAALNGYSYKLVDVQGKELYNALVTNVKTEISMKTFGKAGVYILHVVDANNVSIETKQIVLE